MRYPSRDLTDQLIKSSYQDVVQQYYVDGIPTGDLNFLDGLGNVIFKIPSGSIGKDITVVTGSVESASYADLAFLSSTSSYLSGSGTVINGLQFDIQYATSSMSEGWVFWDNDSHTLAIKPDITGSTLQVGQELWLRYTAEEDIANGNAIYISSKADPDGHPICSKAIADGSRTKYAVVGLATHDNVSGSHGFATIKGIVNDIDTSAYPAGSPLFLSETTSGGYRIGAPAEPYERILLGYCVKQDATVGRVFVDVVGIPDAFKAFVGMVTVPTITTSSLTPTGSIVTIGEASANICTTSDGLGVIRSYTVPSASFALTSSFLDAQYVVVTYNSGSPIYQIVTDRSTVDSIQTTLVYTLLMGAGGRVSYSNWDAPGTLLANKNLLRIQSLRGIERENGLILSYSGSRYVTVTEGSVWQGIQQISLPSVTSSVDRLVLAAHSASVFSGSTIIQYVNDHYDDGINLQTLGNNNYVTNWVYRGIGNLNTTIIQLSTQYNKPEDAVSANPPVPPTELKDVAILIGRAIFQKGSDTPYQIDSAFVEDFTGGITVHNNLIGLQGGITNEYYHLTATEYSQFQSGTAPTDYRTVTGSQSILTTDSILYASASSANIILTMPTSSAVAGQIFRIKKIDSSGYDIIITSSVNIDYDKELRLTQRGSSVTLHSNNTQYWIH